MISELSYKTKILSVVYIFNNLYFKEQLTLLGFQATLSFIYITVNDKWCDNGLIRHYRTFMQPNLRFFDFKLI